MNDKAKSVNVQGGRIAQALGKHDFPVCDTVAERKKPENIHLTGEAD